MNGGSSRILVGALGAALAACGGSTAQVDTAKSGVVFAYPVDAQLDVPTGTRVVVAFSDPVVASALGACTGNGSSGGFCLVRSDGTAVSAMPTVGADGKTVELDGLALDEATQYSLYIGASLAPTAQNLPSGPLVTFTTRGARPRAAAPKLVAINGAPPASPEAFRPMLDTSTIRLVFSEPLDPRSVEYAQGAVALVDSKGALVPATLVSDGIHVSIDPISDLAGGAAYTVELGAQLVDLGGEPLAPTTIALTPHDTRGTLGPIPQVLRTRQMGDPGTTAPRTGGTPNQISVVKPLIGAPTQQLLASTLASELGDPTALGGPIAFTLRRGQRMRLSGLNLQLGGQLPVGLNTGDVMIELLTDAGGLLYRNPHQSPDQKPENDRAPLYVDLSMDVAVYAMDPQGNAVLAQSILGVQGSGVVTATQGVLDIESVAAMDFGLLGVTTAPSNMTLELITDPTATPTTNTTAPTLVATYPHASDELPVDAGIELVFSEPIDLDKARGGAVVLADAGGTTIPALIESHGSAIVVRPRAPLAYSTNYQVTLDGVVDVSGLALAKTTLLFSTPQLTSTGVPPTIVAAHPGAPCALTGASGGSPGRCSGGNSGDDLYQPFTLAANEPIDIAFSQPLHAASVVLGTQCNAGSVRVEEIDGSGACSAVVPGTLIRHDRSIQFVPDVPWTVGKQYRLSLISGGNQSCGAGVLCGLQSAASFDPLSGTTSSSGGGPNATFDFTGAPASPSTYMVNTAVPYTDINGSGFLDGQETAQDANRAALHITGTSGSISGAHFNGPFCAGSTTDACVYLMGAMPVEMQPVQANCTLPDGSTATSCMPVQLSAQVMYGTSVSMTATLLVDITNDTGTQLMRVREPAGSPVLGYVVEKNGKPTLVAKLDLYMDAPDLSLPLGTTHDLHSKPISIALEGPMTFLADGRIAIAAANTADVPITINISPPIGGNGAVDIVIPAGEMHLQLVSPALRGAPL